GHQEAFEKGMLHRDISEGNVMISRDPDVPYKGFVQDFDYSLNWQKFLASLKLFENLTGEDWDKFEEIKRQCKLRTGTLYFKAIDLLSPGDVVHEVRHDLESFFWLFIWILLRHTIHLLGLGACERLFNQDDEAACQDAKTGWFSVANVLQYIDNEPLTQLVSEFTIACKTNYRINNAEPSDPLTHKKVLEIFDKALPLDSWP
ncbi:hypothetical protein FOMPIDRAFT_1098433, partial [Fomitopsis schrenkii]